MAKSKSHPYDRDLRLLAYLLPGGWKVLVGRRDADNDRLSLKVARPDDWWFHVHGLPGSHVILKIYSRSGIDSISGCQSIYPLDIQRQT